jgi:hypothetical protein
MQIRTVPHHTAKESTTDDARIAVVKEFMIIGVGTWWSFFSVFSVSWYLTVHTTTSLQQRTMTSQQISIKPHEDCMKDPSPSIPEGKATASTTTPSSPSPNRLLKYDECELDQHIRESARKSSIFLPTELHIRSFVSNCVVSSLSGIVFGCVMDKVTLLTSHSRNIVTMSLFLSSPYTGPRCVSKCHHQSDAHD